MGTRLSRRTRTLAVSGTQTRGLQAPGEQEGTWCGAATPQLSTQHHPALAALGDKGWGGEGSKARQILRRDGGHDHHPGVSLGGCITFRGIAGNLAVSHNDLFCGGVSGTGIHRT